jgi:hypothetical protein
MIAKGVEVRPIELRDEARWRCALGCLHPLLRAPTGGSDHAPDLARIFDPASPVKAIVAERAGQVIGIANYLTHESTSTLAADLLPAGPVRGSRSAAAAVRDARSSTGWSRNASAAAGRASTGNTRHDNHAARALYDKYVPESGFVRYVIRFDA